MAKNVILDAGHGGTDSGAIGTGIYNKIYEKNLTLSIVKFMNEFLKADKNYNPILTRTSDVYMSVDARHQLTNKSKPDLFMSIHFNSAAGTTGKGFEVYPHVPYEKFHTESVSLARTLVDNMRDIQTIRGIDACGIRYAYLVNKVRQFAEFNHKNAQKYSTYYGVVRQADCPAVLIETAFINNPEEIIKFNTDDKLKIVAARYYRAICAYFGTTPLFDAFGQKIGSDISKIYRVQVGAFSTRSNALNFQKQIKAMGLDAFVVDPTTDKFYRVQVGAFSKKENAEYFLTTVKAKGLNAFIV